MTINSLTHELRQLIIHRNRTRQKTGRETLNDRSMLGDGAITKQFRVTECQLSGILFELLSLSIG